MVATGMVANVSNARARARARVAAGTAGIRLSWASISRTPADHSLGTRVMRHPTPSDTAAQPPLVRSAPTAIGKTPRNAVPTPLTLIHHCSQFGLSGPDSPCQGNAADTLHSPSREKDEGRTTTHPKQFPRELARPPSRLLSESRAHPLLHTDHVSRATIRRCHPARRSRARRRGRGWGGWPLRIPEARRRLATPSACCSAAHGAPEPKHCRAASTMSRPARRQWSRSTTKCSCRSGPSRCWRPARPRSTLRRCKRGAAPGAS